MWVSGFAVKYPSSRFDPERKVWVSALPGVWLCLLALPSGFAFCGFAFWLCLLALPSGFAFWLCLLALPSGFAFWLCPLALPSGFARAILVVWIDRLVRDACAWTRQTRLEAASPVRGDTGFAEPNGPNPRMTSQTCCAGVGYLRFIEMREPQLLSVCRSIRGFCRRPATGRAKAIQVRPAHVTSRRPCR